MNTAIFEAENAFTTFAKTDPTPFITAWRTLSQSEASSGQVLFPVVTVAAGDNYDAATQTALMDLTWLETGSVNDIWEQTSCNNSGVSTPIVETPQPGIGSSQSQDVQIPLATVCKIGIQPVTGATPEIEAWVYTVSFQVNETACPESETDVCLTIQTDDVG